MTVWHGHTWLFLTEWWRVRQLMTGILWVASSVMNAKAPSTLSSRFLWVWHYVLMSFKIDEDELLVHPEAIAFGVGLCFTADVHLFIFLVSIARSPRCIGRSAWNLAQCSVLDQVLQCWSKILWAFPQRNFRGQKHAKFGPISVKFKLRWRISSDEDVDYPWFIVVVPSKLHSDKYLLAASRNQETLHK